MLVTTSWFAAGLTDGSICGNRFVVLEIEGDAEFSLALGCPGGAATLLGAWGVEAEETRRHGVGTFACKRQVVYVDGCMFCWQPAPNTGVCLTTTILDTGSTVGL